MKKLLSVAALMVTVLACTLSGGQPATPTTSLPVASAAAPATATAVPPTAIPPSPTPLPSPITAENVYGLAVFTYFAEGELVRSLDFSPDGSAVAAAVSDPAATIGTIQLFDTASGQPLRTLEGHTLAVWGLRFSPDGRFLASAGRDHTARVWDWRDGSLVRSLDFPNEVTSVEFSPDSRTLAVGGVDEAPGQALEDATIWSYAVDTWEPGPEYAEFWNISDIAYNPTGSLILGGGTSRNVRVWRASDGAEQFILYHAGQVGGIDVSPDGTRAATGLCEQSVNSQCVRGAIWLWDLATGTLVRQLSDFSEGVVDVAFSTDGSAVIGATRSGELRAYAVSDYRLLLEATSPPGGSQPAIVAMALSWDGRLLATAGNRRIDLWRVGP